MQQRGGSMPVTELNDNQSEIIKYNVPDMPIKSFTSDQYDYPTLSFVNHWHTDFEFAYLRKGSMMYNVNGENIPLCEGDMIMVNSGQLHYNWWEKPCDCEFVCLIFHPSLLDQSICRIFLDKISGHGSPPYCIFHENIASERSMISLAETVCSCAERPYDGCGFDIMSSIYKLCGLLYEHFKGTEIRRHPDRRRLESVRSMVGYIQQRYAEKITLEDIAEAGMVCRSACCTIFREYLGKTPIEYLNEYRISKSTDMLRESRENITHIASACGFSNSSYFTETFVKLMKCTPRDYRSKANAQEEN